MNVNLIIKLLRFEIKVAQTEQDAECNTDRSVHAVVTPNGANEAFKTHKQEKGCKYTD